MHIAWKYLKYKAMEENKSILSPRKSLFYDNVCLSPKEQIDLHRQSFWELTFIVLGSGIRLIGDTSEFFQAEEVIMIPPGIPHCWYFDCNDTGNDGKIHNITVTFSDTFLNNCQSSFPELSLSVSKLKNIHEAVKYNKPTTTLIVSILKEMKNQDDVEQLSSMIKLLPLLASTTTIQTVGKYQKRNKKQERLNMIRIYVTCNLSRNISLDDIAHHVGMNKPAFCTFFKLATGKTFITYLNECRIERVCQLLKEKKLSISEICYAAGFTDIPYFNRVFKKNKGCTPSAYRNQS